MNVAVVRRATAGLAAWLARDGVARHGRGRARRAARVGRRSPTAAAEVLAGRRVRRPGARPARCRRRCSRSPSASWAPSPACRSRRRTTRPPTTATRSTSPTARSSRRRPTPRSRRRSRPCARGVRADRRPTASAVDVTESYLDRVARLPRGTAPGRCGRAHPDARRRRRDRGARAAPGGLHRRARRGRRRPRRTPTSRRSRSRTRRSPAPPTRCSRWPRRSTPTWPSRSTRTPTAARWACRGPAPAGGWRMLTGDETGVLLGDHLLRTGSAHADPLVATTVVSSSMLRAGRGGARRPLRRDADRLQVDRPRRPRPGLRLRGGTGLLRRPGRGARQGRHRRGHASPATWRPRCKAAGAGPARPARRAGRRARRAPHPRASRCAWSPAARDAAVARLRAPPPQGWAVDPPRPGRAAAAPRR